MTMIDYGEAQARLDDGDNTPEQRSELERVVSAYERSWDMVVVATERWPNACRHCGFEQRGHAQRWARPVGFHTWTAPTDAQRLLRMRARRALRLTGDLRPIHAREFRRLLAPATPVPTEEPTDAA